LEEKVYLKIKIEKINLRKTLCRLENIFKPFKENTKNKFNWR